MKALELAIKKKEDTVRYYREAAAKCGHPAGRRMFEVVLEDEVEHLGDLKRILTDDSGSGLSPREPGERMKGILRTMQDRERLDVACSLDDMEAFRIAMDLERNAYDFFMEQAARARDDSQRLIFEQLAHDEERHYEVLSETHSFLTDTGNWFMWDEHSIVEG